MMPMHVVPRRRRFGEGERIVLVESLETRPSELL
jgi:hypothetical protein